MNNKQMSYEITVTTKDGIVLNQMSFATFAEMREHLEDLEATDQYRTHFSDHMYKFQKDDFKVMSTWRLLTHKVNGQRVIATGRKQR